MPRRCCVPLCKSNYHNAKEYVTTYAFPKDPTMRNKWLYMMKQQEDYVITTNSAVCIKHFEENFLNRVDSAVRKDGSILTVTRRIPGLIKNAYPTLFPEPSVNITNLTPLTPAKTNRKKPVNTKTVNKESLSNRSSKTVKRKIKNDVNSGLAKKSIKRIKSEDDASDEPSKKIESRANLEVDPLYLPLKKVVKKKLSEVDPLLVPLKTVVNPLLGPSKRGRKKTNFEVNSLKEPVKRGRKRTNFEVDSLNGPSKRGRKKSNFEVNSSNGPSKRGRKKINLVANSSHGPSQRRRRQSSPQESLFSVRKKIKAELKDSSLSGSLNKSTKNSDYVNESLASTPKIVVNEMEFTIDPILSKMADSAYDFSTRGRLRIKKQKGKERVDMQAVKKLCPVDTLLEEKPFQFVDIETITSKNVDPLCSLGPVGSLDVPLPSSDVPVVTSVVPGKKKPARSKHVQTETVLPTTTRDTQTETSSLAAFFLKNVMNTKLKTSDLNCVLSEVQLRFECTSRRPYSTKAKYESITIENNKFQSLDKQLLSAFMLLPEVKSLPMRSCGFLINECRDDKPKSLTRTKYVSDDKEHDSDCEFVTMEPPDFKASSDTETDEQPISTDKQPISMDKQPISIDKRPISIDKRKILIDERTQSISIEERPILIEKQTISSDDKLITTTDEDKLNRLSYVLENDTIKVSRGVRFNVICIACMSLFETREDLDRHVVESKSCDPHRKTKEPPEPERRMCDHCGEFLTTASLQNHIHAKHEQEAPPGQMFKCPRCDREFQKASALGRHMSVHDDVDRFMCPVCKKTFKTKLAIKSHLRNDHNLQKDYVTITNRIYECLICSKVFRSGVERNEHQVLCIEAFRNKKPEVVNSENLDSKEVPETSKPDKNVTNTHLENEESEIIDLDDANDEDNVVYLGKTDDLDLSNILEREKIKIILPYCAKGTILKASVLGKLDLEKVMKKLDPNVIQEESV